MDKELDLNGKRNRIQYCAIIAIRIEIAFNMPAVLCTLRYRGLSRCIAVRSHDLHNR